ncbi:MAG: ATP-binding protein [Mariprofundaceae bacterium]
MSKHLSIMLEHIPGCIWAASSMLKYTDVSARAEKVFGLPEEKLQGCEIWSWLSDETQRNANMRQLRTAIEQQQSDLELAYCTDIGGREEWFGENIHLHFSVDETSGGKRLQDLYGISNIITQRKKSEATTLHMQQQARKMEAIGTLVGGIAHEFNNILAGIVGNIFLLKMDVAENSKSAERLGRIDTLSNRAAGLVEQMLAFGRKQRISIRDIELKPLLDQICALEWVDIPAHVRLYHHIPSGVLLRADPTQLKQVLISLIGNAADACREQTSGEINIHLDDVLYDTAFATRFPNLNSADMLCLRISDNGAGIPEAIMDRVFDPFFTTKEVGCGTGMGLSMSYGLIESFGGAIELDSEEGVGTTIRICLLRSANVEARETAAVEEIHDLKFGHGETVLLADDEPLLREAAGSMLEKLGYQPVLIENGHAAVEYIRNNPQTVSIALLDLIMPGMNGHEAAVEIRNICPDLPIIFVTGYNLSNKQDKEISMICSQIINKPYDVRHLSGVIGKLLQTPEE